MKRAVVLATSACLLSLASTANGAATDWRKQALASAAPFIDHANSDWGTAIIKGDAETLSAPYADNGIFIAPDGSIIKGKTAIRAMYANRGRRAEIVSANVKSDGRVAVTPDDVYEWGSASATVKGSKGLTRRSGGRYFTAWHRLHGRWLITRNIAF